MERGRPRPLLKQKMRARAPALHRFIFQIKEKAASKLAQPFLFNVKIFYLLAGLPIGLLPGLAGDIIGDIIGVATGIIGVGAGRV